MVKQIGSFLELAESGQALLISYEEIVGDKRKAMQRLMQHLEIALPSARVDEIVAATEPEAMRVSKKEAGLEEHITRPEHKLGREAFLPCHKEMIDLILRANGPRLPERFGALGYVIIGADSPVSISRPPAKSGSSRLARVRARLFGT